MGITKVQIHELDRIINTVNSMDTEEERKRYLEENVEDVDFFLETLRKVNKNKLGSGRKKSCSAKKDNQLVYQETQVFEFFKSNPLGYIVERYSKAELTAMYYAVYGCKPLSADNKERIAQAIKTYIYTMSRTEVLLGNNRKSQNKESIHMTTYNIAIDGPAGAGKSTIAKMAAKKLGFIYVDTGAMYRAMALYILRQGVEREDEEAVAKACDDMDISLRYENGVQQVWLNGEDVTGLIRTEEVSQTTSAISVYAPVRQKLLELQRELARTNNVIMDGRDIGTCVLPHAQTKIYLTASSHVRAVRRYNELKEKGQMCNLEEIEQDIIERDDRDMHREIAPLTQAEDAVLVDSSQMSIDQVIEAILEAARSRGLKDGR